MKGARHRGAGARGMRTPSERYLTAEDAAARFLFPTTKAFYEFVRRRRIAFTSGRAVVRRGRVLLVDPVAFEAVLRDLHAGRLRRIA